LGPDRPSLEQGSNHMAAPTLAEALAAEVNRSSKIPHVDRLLAELSKDDARVLLEALRGPTSSVRIAKALHAVGYPMGRNAIDGWRARNAAR
jgi:hypothetical protein